MRHLQIYNIILWGQTSAFSRSGFHRLPSPLMGILVLFGFLCEECTQANKTTFPIHVFSMCIEKSLHQRSIHTHSCWQTQKSTQKMQSVFWLHFLCLYSLKKKKIKSPLKEYGILAEMFCSFLTPGGEGARTLCSFSCIQLSQVWTYTKACKTFTTKHPPGILRTFYLY